MFLKLILGGGAALAAAAAAWSGGVVYLDYRTHKKSTGFQIGPGPDKANPKILVAYFSRSGATGLVARKLAQALGADLARIEARAYGLGYLGWFRAIRDARARKRAVISPKRLDLSKYRLVLLGSPIWLYRLAPPLWSFIRNSDFKGNRVVLFNTYNSNYGQDEIERAKAAVQKKGGIWRGHAPLLRNRMLNQISSQELVEKTQRIVDEQAQGWLV